MFPSCSYTSHPRKVQSTRKGRPRLGKGPTLPRGLKGGQPPLRQNFPRTRKSLLSEHLSCFLTTSKSESWKRRGTRKQPRPTEPRDSYASGIWIPHSSPSAISNSRSDKVTPRIEQVSTFESPSIKAILRAFSTESVTGPHGRVKVRVSGEADRAEGLPRLRDTDTSLITFREKQRSLALTSLLPTKSPDTRNKRKRDTALQHGKGARSGLDSHTRPTLQDDLTLQARVLTLEWGGDSLGIDSTFGEARPSLRWRRGPRSSAPKVDVITTLEQSLSGTSPEPATSEASADHLPRVPARPEASADRLRRRTCQRTTRLGSGQPGPIFEPTPPLFVLISLPLASARGRAAAGSL
jgi:hypothetical protein